MNPKLKSILINNPFATFFVDKHHNVFRCDSDRPRPTGLKECDILLNIPEDCRTMVPRRDGKQYRLGKSRSQDVGSMHQSMQLDVDGPYTLKAATTFGTIVLRSGTKFRISRQTMEEFLNQKPIYGEQFIIQRAQLASYIVKQVYGIEI